MPTRSKISIKNDYLLPMNILGFDLRKYENVTAIV